MDLYLFCLKVYFSNSEKINKNKSMLHNVIELGKSEFGEPLNNILGAIYFKNIEKKGNDDKGNESEGVKHRNNKDNERDEGKYIF